MPIVRAGGEPSRVRLVMAKRLAQQALGRLPHPVGAVGAGEAHWWHVSLFERVAVTDAGQGGVRVRQRDPEAFKRLGRDGARVLWRFVREGDAAAGRWREADAGAHRGRELAPALRDRLTCLRAGSGAPAHGPRPRTRPEQVPAGPSWRPRHSRSSRSSRVRARQRRIPPPKILAARSMFALPAPSVAPGPVSRRGRRAAERHTAQRRTITVHGPTSRRTKAGESNSRSGKATVSKATFGVGAGTRRARSSWSASRPRPDRTGTRAAARPDRRVQAAQQVGGRPPSRLHAPHGLVAPLVLRQRVRVVRRRLLEAVEGLGDVELGRAAEHDERPAPAGRPESWSTVPPRAGDHLSWGDHESTAPEPPAGRTPRPRAPRCSGRGPSRPPSPRRRRRRARPARSPRGRRRRAPRRARAAAHRAAASAPGRAPAPRRRSAPRRTPARAPRSARAGTPGSSARRAAAAASARTTRRRGAPGRRGAARAGAAGPASTRPRVPTRHTAPTDDGWSIGNVQTAPSSGR